MAVKSIQLGQVWRKDENGQDYLVTKVYSEVFTQYAVLRPAEVTAPDAPTVKVKVAKSAEGTALPISGRGGDCARGFGGRLRVRGALPRGQGLSSHD